MENYPAYARRKGLLWGVVLITIGLALILDYHFGIIDSDAWWRYTPLILVVFGVNKIADFKKPRHLADGFWLIFLGLWLCASMVHWWGLSFHNSWPIVLIGWGLTIIIKSFVKTHFVRVEAHHE